MASVKHNNTNDSSNVVISNINSRVRVAQPDNIQTSEINYDKNHKPRLVNPDDRFNDLKKFADYLSDDEVNKLTKAYNLAKDKHKNQKRKSGESFVVHPIEVAIILSDLKLDIDALCAALLHDVVEDTDTSSDDIELVFNKDVRNLVEGVTKISNIEVSSISDSQALTLRKMFVAMSNDLRVIVIKLADRLHNMRTLYALREDRQVFKARETLEIFAPIAHRLGIDSIKWELEDLSFYYLEPNKYKQIARMVVESRDQRMEYLKKVIDILQDELNKTGIVGKIMGRPKHLYSIFCKMKNKGKAFSEIYDLIAVRILVNSIKDCYSTLGSVHSLWKPIPNRFKDYIAIPKKNLYQSLHTSVLGPAGRPLEVQIRTNEMHRMSEFGVAAHWRYKEKSIASDKALDAQLAWLREMVNWQDQTSDSKEMLKTLKVNLVNTEVFIFTPNGEAKSLKAGSTPIDFAYAIHTQVGNHCVGAKVNDSIVPLNYELQTGDRVEILTQKSAKPSRDWLSYVKTPSAKSKIKSYFKKQSRDDDLQVGKEILKAELRKNSLGFANVSTTKAIKELASELYFNSPEEMYIKIGNGTLSGKSIVKRLQKKLIDNNVDNKENLLMSKMTTISGQLPKMQTDVNKTTKQKSNNSTLSSNNIVVNGIDNPLVTLAKCCKPIPGDEIIGFITKGKGISIHRESCPNIKSLKKEENRIIDVSWNKNIKNNDKFRIEIYVKAVDREDLLRDMIEVFSALKTNFVSINANSHNDGTSSMRFIFELKDFTLSDKIISGLKQVKGMITCYRVK